MPTNFAGSVSPEMHLFYEILFASPGNPFTNAVGSFESMKLGARSAGKLTRTPKSVEDVGKRPFPNRVGYAIEFDSMQTTLPVLLNAYLLSRQFCQARFKTRAGRFYNFVNNTNLATPAGSSLISLGFEFTLGTNERSLKLMAEGEMYPQEWDWILAQLGTGHAGSTGTLVDLNLTQVGYDRTQYAYTGIAGVTYEGNSLGNIMSGTKITLKSAGSSKDNRERTYFDRIEVSGEIISNQTDATTLKAFSDNLERTDGDLVITTANGESIKLTDGAVGFEAPVEIADGKFEVKATFKGEVPYNADDATPTTVDIGVTTSTELVLDLGIYA
jgi:hypothetical protein